MDLSSSLLEEKRFHESMSMVNLPQSVHGSVGLAFGASGSLGASCFFGAFSFCGLPAISLYFFESNWASFWQRVTSPMTDLTPGWLAMVWNHRLTLAYGLRNSAVKTFS